MTRKELIYELQQYGEDDTNVVLRKELINSVDYSSIDEIHFNGEAIIIN